MRGGSLLMRAYSRLTGVGWSGMEGGVVKLSCEECGHGLSDGDVDLDLMVANCPQCGAVFGFDAPPDTPVEAPVDAPVVDAPPSAIRVAHEGGETVLSYRWFSWMVLFLVPFCVFWDGFMVVWFGTSIASGAYDMALFGVLHGAVGVGITYYTAAIFINETTVRLSKRLLSVKHGPLPWFGSRELDPGSLDQLYCVRVRHKNKNSVTYTFTLRAQLTTKRTVDILRGLSDAAVVKWLEAFIEAEVGIQNRPMGGEWDG
jgi:hypothetical protein